MKKLVDWYIKYIRAEEKNWNDVYTQKFASASEEKKAKMLLIGSHQWYLTCFHSEIREEILSMLCTTKPWEQQSLATSFEDLFEEWKAKLDYEYVNQLTFYDVALRMAILQQREELRPQRYVYLHATPLAAYRWLYKHKKVNAKVSGSSAIIEIRDLKGAFGALTAKEIEDLLCRLAKAITRQKDGKQHTSKLERDNVLDDIFNEIQNK